MLVKGDLQVILRLITKEWIIYDAELMSLIFDLQAWIREYGLKIVFSGLLEKKMCL